MLQNTSRLWSLVCRLSTGSSSLINKKDLDFSLVPKIAEEDLQVQYVRGSGPGGQATAKTNNCVILMHKPSGIVVKCHQTRSQEQNRKIAQELLVTKLDNKINGDRSIEAQTKALEKKKLTKAESKRRKMAELKAEWKEREGLT